MEIVESTAAFEDWLRGHLGGELIKKDVDLKHEKMGADAFQFLRATYWRWAETVFDICPKFANAPAVLSVGDIHVENFGTWRDYEGRLVWGVNDFDEAAEMPFVLDLARLATSAVLAEVPGMSTRKICAALLAGYATGLAAPAPIVLDRDDAWLLKLVAVKEAARREFWKKNGPRANAKDARKRRAALKSGEPPVSYIQALEVARPDPGVELTFWPRVAGTGSLGRPRWIGWGMWRGAPIIREAKAMLPSAWTRRTGSSTRIRCHEAAFGKYRSPDPWYVLQDTILVRRLSPNNRKIEVAKDDSKKSELVNEPILTAMGRDIAAVHLGAVDRRAEIRDDLAKRKHKEADWLAAVVDKLARSIRGEQDAWNEHRKEQGFDDKAADRATRRAGPPPAKQ